MGLIMYKKRFYGFAVTAIVLTGCGGGNYQQNNTAQLSPSQKLSRQYVDDIKRSNQLTRDCSEAVNKTDEAVLIHKEVLFASQGDANAKDLMSSKLRINAKQSAALDKFIIAQKSCRALRIDSLKNVPYLASAYLDYFKKSDELASLLLSKKITIGEANQKVVTLLQERTVSINEARQKITTDLGAMRQKEIALALQQQGVAAQQAQADAARRANDRLMWKDINDSLKPQWMDSTPSCLGPGCRQ